MRRSSRSVPRALRARSDLPGIAGTARLDRRTKDLVKRLGAGEIAIIDHADLDRVAAVSLIRCGAAAVVNAARSISGRYPNLGPGLLLDAGIPLLDDVGAEVFERIREGQTVRLENDTLYVAETVVAKGTPQDPEAVAAAVTQARESLAGELKAFVANTMEYVEQESEILFEGIRIPQLATRLEGQHALVVARGYRHREDLLALRAYIREFKPVMVAVDGGADTLLETGCRPALIVGDMDSVSDRALRCGAELVVHAYPDGRAPGLARIERLGLNAAVCPAPGTSEDMAVLLADEAGASLIATVGMRFSLAEFLDKGRAGMGSAVLTKIRVGDKVVDAKGVSRLHRSRISGRSLLLLTLAAVVTVVVAAISLPGGQLVIKTIGLELEQLRFWFVGLF